MTLSPSSALPDVLDALREDIGVANEIVVRLNGESDVATRAEMTMNLISVTSMISDTMERAVYGALDFAYPDLARRARDESTRLREAMLPVDEHLRHVAPADVHRSDPEGFEHDLAEFLRIFAEVMTWETNEIYPRLMSLGGNERTELKDNVAKARKHASEHPVSGGSIARVLHKVEAKMERHPDIADRD